MNRSLNTQHPIAAAYEPPQMTVVPIRASGAMLVGSAPVERMQQYEMDASFGSNFQQAYEDDFSTESMTTASGWGSDFYD